MSRIIAFIGALALTTVLGSTIAFAQPQGSGYYAATPVEAPAKNSIITRDTMWKFRDGAFTASKAPERDLVLCQLVAQRVGKLTSFSADSLAKCNAKAD